MNKHRRYIPIIIIKNKHFSFSYSIGNPLWFVYEFKQLWKERRKQ